METRIQQATREWEAAYTAANPTSPPPEITLETASEATLNGERMNLSEIKIATNHLKGVAKFTPASETPDERQELVTALKSGNKGNLTVGKTLQNRFKKGKGTEHLEAWLRTQGLRLPEPSTCTKFRKAYETWVENAGLEIGETYRHPDFTDDAGHQIGMTLEGVSTFALYKARNLVTKDNAVETLALCYTSTQQEIEDAASDRDKELEPSEGMRSLPKIPESMMERFKDVTTFLPGKSRLEVVAFMIEFVSDLADRDPDTFRETVAAYFGEAEE